jgi:catechol-2,3-dioxygenase
MINRPEDTATATRIVPAYMAHIALKTRKYREMIAWYKTVFHAESLYSTDIVTFLTFDEEHHRFALIDISKNGVDAVPQTLGTAHFAFTYRTVEDLLDTYGRLKAIDIPPANCVNHDLTISMYYRDPDGNSVELQADTYATEEEGKAVFTSEKFLKTPFGRPYDPDSFSESFRSGDPFEKAMSDAETAVA